MGTKRKSASTTDPSPAKARPWGERPLKAAKVCTPGATLQSRRVQSTDEEDDDPPFQQSQAYLSSTDEDRMNAFSDATE